MDGPNLGERLAASGPLPWRLAVDIGVQVADALETIHRAGLIHRDVKPANIMLVSDGPPAQVKLIDFGWARITENYRDPAGFTPEPRRPTGLGLAIGTPGYLPLEAGLVPADERFDVFGLGATLYELLTGELPGIEPLRPLHEVYPDCDAPSDLNLILAAALALEPGDRTQTAAELGAALKSIRLAHADRKTTRWLDARYELLSVLGTGAKGETLLANHRGSGHDVALKFLRSTAADDLSRFKREAELLAFLDTPGLPRFFDYAPQADRPYIAMGRAPGVPAARFCLTSDKIRLRPAEVVEVGLQMARILRYLHERGVLHRDINANNVIIELGRTPRVTLIDLGSAALTNEFYTHVSRRYITPPEARVVIPDGGIEKLAWSAPEVKAGEGWTGKSDVYSLGLLLFRLLTGKVPTAHGPVSVHHVAGCPEELATVVSQALQHRPDDRPTAAQLEVAFADILEEAEMIRLAKQPDTNSAHIVSVAELPTPAATIPTPPVMPSAEPPRQATSPTSVVFADSRPLWRLYTTVAVIVAVAACAWFAGRMTAPRPDERAAPNISSAPPTPAGAVISDRPEPLAAPVDPPSLPTLRRALDAVAPRVRACNAEGGLMVEYETADGRDQFVRVAVVGIDDPRINDCVREAVAGLHFSPTTAQILHEEYLP